jgi:hypothetical protein
MQNLAEEDSVSSEVPVNQDEIVIIIHYLTYLDGG